MMDLRAQGKSLVRAVEWSIPTFQRADGRCESALTFIRITVRSRGGERERRRFCESDAAGNHK